MRRDRMAVGFATTARGECDLISSLRESNHIDPLSRSKK
jgi:hypothetical protein